jgi:hypothetical protein
MDGMICTERAIDAGLPIKLGRTRHPRVAPLRFFEIESPRMQTPQGLAYPWSRAIHRDRG